MLDYLYFAAFMLVAQLSPGPDMLLILKNSFNHNLRAALFTIAGIISGITIHTTVAITGLAVLITRSTAAYNTIRYAGAIYLSYLGIRLLLSLRKKATTSSATPPTDSRSLPDRAAFTQGFLTNLLNPKAMVIVPSVLVMFLGEDATLDQRLIYGTILVVEGLIVWILLALLLQTRQAKQQFLRWQTPINATFGILLLALAIRAII